MKKYINIMILFSMIIILNGCELFGKTPDKVTIDYNCEGIEKYSCSLDEKKLNCIIIVPECKGNTFVGWYDAKINGTKLNLDADFKDKETIYAVWEEEGKTLALENKEEKTYKVTFDINGGSGNTPTSVEVKKEEMMPSINESIPTRSGYTFMGWYDSREYLSGHQYYNETNEAVKYYDNEKNITLYAGWKENKIETLKPQEEVKEEKYKITFNINGGSGSVPTSVEAIYAGKMPNIEKKIPTRSGYTFVGWYDKSDYTKGEMYYTETNEAIKYYDKKDNMTLYAGWSKEMVIVSYKIIFNANGGSGGQTKSLTVKTGEELPSITNTPPTRSGYRFAGWYDKKEGGTEYYSSTGQKQIKFNESKNIILYARWEANRYRVTFNANGGSGSVPSSVEAEYGKQVPTINKSIPTRSGYTFVGWYDNSDYTKGKSYYSSKNESVLKYDKAGDITLYAGWSMNATPTYVVTFNAAGGSGGQTANVNAIYGKSMPTISSTAPTRSGYTFEGWYDSASGGMKYYNSNGTSAKNYDKTSGTALYARWKAITYNLTYNYNGGVKGSSAPTSAEYDKTITINNPSKVFTITIDSNNRGATLSKNSVKANQEFIGWTASGINTSTAKYGSSTSNSWSTTSDKVKDIYFKNLRSTSGIVTLTANWKSVDMTLPEVTKTGYTCGYSNSASGSITYKSKSKYTPSITSNSIKLYVICNSSKYTISFNANGGSGGQTANIEVSYGSAMPSINTTAPTRSGYTFMGWYDSATGGTQYYTSNGTSAKTFDKMSNTILYAHWEVIDGYLVSFDANGGTGGQNKDIIVKNKEAMPTISNVSPTRKGYTFKGWFNNADYTKGTKYYGTDGKPTMRYNKTSNMILYAGWSANHYKVSFDINSGTGTKPGTQTVTFDKEMPKIRKYTLTKQYHTFMGWYDNPDYTKGKLYYNTDGTSAAIYDKDSNITLYAGWKVNKFTVSFNANGGTGGQKSNIIATQGSAMPPISNVAPIKKEYKFIGWYDNPIWAKGTKYYNADGSSAKIYDKDSNITLYAGWGLIFKDTGKLQIYYLSLGRYDGYLIMGNGTTLFIDGGDPAPGHQCVEFLKNLGITEIDGLIGSHLHYNHIAAHEEIIDNFEVKAVYYPDDPRTCKERKTCRDGAVKPEQLAKKLNNIPVNILTPQLNVKIGNILFDILSPFDLNGSTNDNSLNMILKFGNHKFYFTGDTGTTVLKKIKNEYNESVYENISIFKHPHHGQNEVPSNLIQIMAPKYVIVPNISKGLAGSEYKKVNSIVYELGSKNGGYVLAESDGVNLIVKDMRK